MLSPCQQVNNEPPGGAGNTNTTDRRNTAFWEAPPAWNFRPLGVGLRADSDSGTHVKQQDGTEGLSR